MGTVRLVDAAMPCLERSAARVHRDHLQRLGPRDRLRRRAPTATFKAALVHYTQGLAYHLAAKGIRANTVSPGNTYFPGGIW